MTDIRRNITRLEGVVNELKESCNLRFEGMRMWKIIWVVAIAATFSLSGYYVASLKSHEQTGYHGGMPEYVKQVTLPVTEQVVDNRLEIRETQVNYRNLQVQMDRIETKLDKVIEEL